MFKEILPSIKAHLDDRLSNPILGAFSVSWFFFNWKIVLVLLFSKKTVEDKISIIETSYLNIYDIFLFPALFVVFYLFAVPWLSLGIQLFQETVNKRRRESRIESETIEISGKHKLLIAQSDYEKIQIEHDLNMEMERKRREFELEQEKAPHDLDMMRQKHQLEVEFNQQKEDAEHSAKIRNMDIEERIRTEELEIELRRKREEAELDIQKMREQIELEAQK